MKHSAIILSGGKSRRMNYVNKAFTNIYGKPMIEHILSKLLFIDDILVVTNSPEAYSMYDVRAVRDIIPGKGPLSGIHSGLVHAENQYSFVIACDMPFVPEAYVRYCIGLEKKYDIAVPYWGEFWEPACGMYSKKAVDYIETVLNEGKRKIIEIFRYLNVHAIEEEVLSGFGNTEDMFINVNTKEELDRINESEERYAT